MRRRCFQWPCQRPACCLCEALDTFIAVRQAQERQDRIREPAADNRRDEHERRRLDELVVRPALEFYVRPVLRERTRDANHDHERDERPTH